MKKTLVLLSILTFTVQANEVKGTFKATMGDKHYNVPITCYNFTDEKFDTDFMFASDRIAYTDSDGDGIILRGDRVFIGKDRSPIVMDGMKLVLKDKGVHFETTRMELMKQFNKVPKWNKTSNGIKGTSELLKEGETKGTSINYEVICK